MDEIERVEQRKIMVFTVTAFVAFVLVLLWRRDAQLSVFAAVVIALLVAGAHGANNMTREPNWSILQQEASLRGSRLSRLRDVRYCSTFDR